MILYGCCLCVQRLEKRKLIVRLTESEATEHCSVVSHKYKHQTVFSSLITSDDCEQTFGIISYIKTTYVSVSNYWIVTCWHIGHC